MRIPILFTSLIILAAFISPAASQNPLQWEQDLDTALAKAAATNRLVFVEFTAPWCGVCRKMQKQVLSLPEVESRIGSGFVPAKVNVDHYPNIGKQFEITGLPTIAIVTPDGRCLDKHRGQFTRDELLAKLSQFEPQRNLASASPVANPPMASPAQRYAGQQPEYSAAAPPYRVPANPAGPSPAEAQARYAKPYEGPYAGGANPSPRAEPAAADYRGPAIPNLSGDPRAASAPMNPPTAMVPRGPENARTNAAAGAGAYAPDATMNSAGAASYSAPGATDYRRQPVLPAAPANIAPIAPPAIPSNGLGTPPIAPPSVQPTVPPSIPARPNIPAPPSVPAPPIGPQDAALPPQMPTAMEGFCPVTLTESRAWKKGDLRWGVRHEGRLYLFTGPAEKQRFFDDPNRYSPVFAGRDVVAFMERGEYRDGTREHGVFYGDRVYLFSSEESLQQFTAKPYHYATAIARGLGRKADLPQRTSYR